MTAEEFVRKRFGISFDKPLSNDKRTINLQSLEILINDFIGLQKFEIVDKEALVKSQIREMDCDVKTTELKDEDGQFKVRLEISRFGVEILDTWYYSDSYKNAWSLIYIAVLKHLAEKIINLNFKSHNFDTITTTKDYIPGGLFHTHSFLSVRDAISFPPKYSTNNKPIIGVVIAHEKNGGFVLEFNPDLTLDKIVPEGTKVALLREYKI